MKNMKFWRTTLVAALVLTVMLSVTSGTIAWFTDTVTSDSNIIASGTLTAAMEWADGKDAPDTATWKDASEGAIFDYDKWEPGYTEVRHIRIKNTGNLAFKYQLNIVPTGEVSDLADVIDVYYFDGAKQIADRTALAEEAPLGTLTAALAGMPASTSGVLLPADTADEDNPDNLPKGEVMVTVALKMQESAGNEYQGKSIGSQFAVQLLATQLAFEEDSFDETYDENSGLAIEISGVTPVDSIVAALNGTDGMTLMGDGAETTTLSAYNTDVDLDNITDPAELIVEPIVADNLTIADLKMETILDYQIVGGGNTLDSVTVQQTIPNASTNGLTISGSNTTVTDSVFVTGGRVASLYFTDDTDTSVTTVDGCEFGSVENGGSGIYFLSINGELNINNTNIYGSADHALEIGRGSGNVYAGDVNITDTTIYGKRVLLTRLSSLTLKNVVFDKFDYQTGKIVLSVSASQPITFENCIFNKQVQLYSQNGQVIKLINCKYNDTVLDSSNYTNCFTASGVTFQFDNND